MLLVVSVLGRLSGVSLAVFFAALACGFRTGPPEEDGGSIIPDGPDPREGSCDNPVLLPYGNIEVQGRLLGPSRADGWCGAEGSDLGAEDTYQISPPINTDVLVFLIPETDFTPTLRVTRDGCYRDDENVPLICAEMTAEVPYWHFLAEVGHDYSLTVDSPEGTDGQYTMQIYYGEPGPDACPVHATQIDQEIGTRFTWSNSFSSRQGRIDGLCGGPGAENMFQINVFQPGNFVFNVEADESFAPVISLRRGCGATTELTCTSAELQGSSSISLSWFLDPGTYFVVVDQGDIRGGKYRLEVVME